MKVAFLVTEFPSLSETFILSQIAGLVQAGHQVDIYARNAQQATKVHNLVVKHDLLDNTYYHPHVPSNYLVRYLKAFWLILLWFWKAPQAILNALNFEKYGRHATSLKLLYRSIAFIKQGCPTYDVIMCHFGPTGLIALDLKDIGVLEGKICVTFHGLDLSAHLLEAGEQTYNTLFKEAELLLPISNFWKKRLIQLGCTPGKIQVHHMGIDVDTFNYKVRTLDNNETVRLVSVARLVEKKGIEYGIRALKEVTAHHSNVEYIVIGDGILMTELSQLVKELELAEVVHLIGWKRQDEVAQILATSHILIAPSVTGNNGDMEGIPVVLMEAMASGLPVISTWHSGIPELISHQESGILVAERDVSELANHLLELLKRPEWWSQISQKARNKITEEFEINRLNNLLIETFIQISNYTPKDHTSTAI